MLASRKSKPMLQAKEGNAVGLSTEELIEAIAKAICLKLDPDPSGSIRDPHSGATVPNWAKYTVAASAAIDAFMFSFTGRFSGSSDDDETEEETE